MNKTWASGAVELLQHAVSHSKGVTGFDKRMAFISVDNAAELMVKTYLSLPKQFFGAQRASRKEMDEAYNNFTAQLELLFKYAASSLIGIEPGDLEYYHRLRNKLYHDGTGLSVDDEQLNAYLSICKILLKRLFNVELSDDQTLDIVTSTYKDRIIENWNRIQELLAEVFDTGQVHNSTFKWEEAQQKGLLSHALTMDIVSLNLARNLTVHSNEVDEMRLRHIFEQSVDVEKRLKEQVERNHEKIQGHNLFYGPAVSEIAGLLYQQTFFGPPNYGESPEKDTKEIAWILELEQAINVHQLEEADTEEGASNTTMFNVNKVQLHFTSNKFEDKAAFENNRVRVKGTFWQGYTGYHLTPVLMSVININLI